MDILKVNNVAIKNPQTMVYEFYDLDSEEGSGRSQTGLMFRDRVAQKRKLTCTFPPMMMSEMYTLLKAVEPQFFTLTFPDPYTNNMNATMTCYVGNRSAPVFKLDKTTGTFMYEPLSMNFIER